MSSSTPARGIVLGLLDLPQAKQRRTAPGRSGDRRRRPARRPVPLPANQAPASFCELRPTPPAPIVIDDAGAATFHATDLDHVLPTKRVGGGAAWWDRGPGSASTRAHTRPESRGLNVSILVKDCRAHPDPVDHELEMKLLRIERGYVAGISTRRTLSSPAPGDSFSDSNRDNRRSTVVDRFQIVHVGPPLLRREQADQTSCK